MNRWLKVVRISSLLGIFALLTLTFLYFSPWLAGWLLLLSGLTLYRPALGVSTLFLVVSIDTVQSVFGNIFVSYSELEFAACLLAWITNYTNDWVTNGTNDTNFTKLKRVDWRALKWGAPFIGTVFLSALVNNEWYRILPHVLRVSEFIVAALLMANAVREEPSRSRFRWFLAGAATLYIVAGAIQFPTAYRSRIFSEFTNPNQFAGYLLSLLPFLLVFFFSTSGKRIRLLWGALTLLAWTALLAAQSRSALVAALIASLLVWYWYYESGIGSFLKHPLSSAVIFIRRSGVALAATLTGLSFFIALLFSTSSAREYLDNSWRIFEARMKRGITAGFLDQRVPYFDLGWEIWKDHWVVGVGPGNYEDLVENEYWTLVESYRGRIPYFEGFRKTSKTHAHSLYLQLAVSFGVLGLTAFLYLMLRLWLEYSRHRRGSILSLAGMGLLLGFLVHNLLDVTFLSLGLELGLLLGFALPPHPSLEGTGRESI